MVQGRINVLGIPGGGGWVKSLRAKSCLRYIAKQYNFVYLNISDSQYISYQPDVILIAIH